MIKVKLLDNRILVLPDEREEKTKSGLIIPEDMQERSAKGTVIAVGEGLITPTNELIPIRVKVKEIIYYGKFVGNEITLDDTEYIIMRDVDILLIEEK